MLKSHAASRISSWIVAAGLLTAAGPFSVQAHAAYSLNELKANETSEETRIREIREQEVTQLRITLGRRSPKNRMAELYHRLAEVYLESYRAAFLLEGRVHEKRLASGQQGKTIDHSYSRPFLTKGVKACQELIRLKISYNRLDQIYYFLGFNYGELGNSKESIRNFEILVKHYPRSPFAAEALRELGDAYYEKVQYRKALPYYEQAARNANDAIRPRVYHKLAWTYYRLKDYNRAVSTMKEAITSADQSGEKFLSLREEALRDMALFMTEGGKVDEAIGYFQTVAGDKSFYPKVLEKLGKQYERNVEPAKATQVYESLVKTNPESDAAFRVVVKLVDLDLRRGLYKDAVKRIQAVKVPDSGDADTKVAASNLRAMVRRTATEHHETYRKKKSRADLEVAELYYTTYLNSFLSLNDPRNESPEIQMYLAEVKRDLGKSKEASAIYRKVIDSRDARYSKEAGALWTASLAEAMKKAGHTRKNAVEPSELEKEFVDAADQLQDALGETNEGREAALKAAQVLAGYKNTREDSVRRVKRIIDRAPKSPQALIAARLWVQIHAEQLPDKTSSLELSGDAADALDELKDTVKTLRENKDLMAADHESGGNKLRTLLADQDTRLKVGAIARDEKNQAFDEAAKGYENIAAESSQREFAEKAYANAIGSFVKVADFESVDRVSNAWLKRFPKSAKATEAVRSAATVALIQGNFDLSGRFFEKMGRDGSDGESLETAARLFEGNGEVARAQAVWTVYLKTYPKSSQRWSVALQLAKSFDKAHRDSEAGKMYRYCLAGPTEFEAECGARLGDLYLRNQDGDGARAIFKRTAALGGRAKKKELSPFVAYARFRLAELMEAGKKFDPLRLPETQLKRALNQRLEFLEPLSRAYMAAVEGGGPWGVAALSRLAAWAMKFAEEVDAIPLPANASVETVSKFRKNLESVSIPLRRKAYATWSEAYSKAVASEILSPVLPELADRLVDGKQRTPGRAQGAKGGFRIAGAPADGGSDGKTRAFEKTRERLTRNVQDSSSWVDYGNLLWGEGRPILAKLAYERALSLNPRNPAALNNRGVVGISGEGEEHWMSVAESDHLFDEALRHDGFFLAAKINRAALFNYYRLFAKARILWVQVLTKETSADTQDGLAVALQGLGESALAEAAFKKASELGASDSRFTYVYHEAARSSLDGPKGAERCVNRLLDLSESALAGFERSSFDHLKGICAQWKDQK